MISIDKIKELINSTDSDVEKLEKGQKSCAVRIRKVLMEIIRTAKEGRKEVMEIKNGNGQDKESTSDGSIQNETPETEQPAEPEENQE